MFLENDRNLLQEPVQSCLKAASLGNHGIIPVRLDMSLQNNRKLLRGCHRLPPEVQKVDKCL
jgi:hypothetical protein